MHVQILKIVSLKKIVVRLGIPAIDNLRSYHILCGLLSCWYFFFIVLFNKFVSRNFIPKIGTKISKFANQ